MSEERVVLILYILMVLLSVLARVAQVDIMVVLQAGDAFLTYPIWVVAVVALQISDKVEHPFLIELSLLEVEAELP
jgi:hypothetical protein